MIRQGDVLLVPLAAIPSDAVPEAEVGERLVVADGEVTGHSHSMSRRTAKAYRRGMTTGNQRYIRVSEPTTLTHEEHDAIIVPAGDYELVPQLEYTPGEIRRVSD